jgi:hypothetical protein
MDSDGAEVLSLVVKATYDLPNNTGDVELSQEQLPLEWEDIYEGEPGKSSLRYESDAVVEKKGTDVVLIGHAYAKRIGDPYVDVSIKVGKMQKSIRVFGDRSWDKILGISTISEPKPFQKIPLIFELAFGGTDTSHSNPLKHEYEPRNPVGIGFRAKHSKLPIDGTRLPNLENSKELINSPKDRPSPIGFGFIAKNWKPRIDFSGTYDDRWMKTRMPLLPEDFNDRFYNSASTDLIANGFLTGGEVVEIQNASESGRNHFTIPKVMLNGSLLIDAKLCKMDMKLDTVVINTDLSKLILVWRGSWNVHKVIENVRWVRAELEENKNG